MNAFDVWLIIVGLAIGAGLAWLVMIDMRRHDDDIAAGELPAEAAWIADTLRRGEIAADPEAVEEVLRLHRAYLAGIPDDRAWPAAPAGDVGREFDDDENEARFESPGPGSHAAVAAEGPAIASADPDWSDEEAVAAHQALEALLNRSPAVAPTPPPVERTAPTRARRPRAADKAPPEA